MNLSTIFIPVAAIVVAVLPGWSMNIYKLATECDFVAPYKCEAIRAIGLVPPIGAVVGWIDLGK